MNHRLNQRLRRRLYARGVTLFEVLIVVAILAMVAGGVAVYALPQWQKATRQQAESGAQTIRGAAQQWKMSNTDCPTVSQLVQEKILDKGTNSNDPWGQPYVISCDGDDITVSSAGPDKQKGNADDIAVPKPAAEGG